MSESLGDVRLSAFGMTNVGRVRTNNEDSFILSDLDQDEVTAQHRILVDHVGDRGILLAVSDGMGGAAAGEIASAVTVESLKHWLEEDHEDVDTGSLVQHAVEEANRNVFDASQEFDRKGMGATLTAVLVRGDTAHIAEVGDSRAYLVRNGRIRQVTRDQSYVQLLVEQGVITRDQAESSPYRNVILQAMGQRANIVVALGRLELRRGDRFILCSDGLSGKVLDDEIRDIVGDGDDFESACTRLIELANERGGEDNITVVVAEVSGDGLRESHRDESITRTLSDVVAYSYNAQREKEEADREAAEKADLSAGTQVLAAPAAEPAQAPPMTATPAEAVPGRGAEAASRSSAWLWIVLGILGLVVVAAVVIQFMDIVDLLDFLD